MHTTVAILPNKCPRYRHNPGNKFDSIFFSSFDNSVSQAHSLILSFFLSSLFTNLLTLAIPNHPIHLSSNVHLFSFICFFTHIIQIICVIKIFCVVILLTIFPFFEGQELFQFNTVFLDKPWKYYTDRVFSHDIVLVKLLYCPVKSLLYKVDRSAKQFYPAFPKTDNRRIQIHIRTSPLH